MTRSLRTNQNGLSLIELLIATAVTGTLIAIIMGFLSNQLVQNAMHNARSVLLLESQTALDVVNTDIKHASRVDDVNRWSDPHAPGAPGDTYSWEPDEETLVLATPAKDADDNFIYDDPFAYVTHKNNLVYFLEDGTLYKRRIASNHEDNAMTTTCPSGTPDCPSDVELINNVSSFLIQYYDSYDNEVEEPDQARSVRVTVGLSDQVYGRDITAEFSIRSVFRNE